MPRPAQTKSRSSQRLLVKNSKNKKYEYSGVDVFAALYMELITLFDSPEQQIVNYQTYNPFTQEGLVLCSVKNPTLEKVNGIKNKIVFTDVISEKTPLAVEAKIDIPKQVKLLLQRIRSENPGDQIPEKIIIPINISGRHFTFLMVQPDPRNRNKADIIYVNPFGDQDSRYKDKDAAVIAAVKKVYSDINTHVTVNTKKIQAATDSYACGPLTVANAVFLAEQKNPAELVTSTDGLFNQDDVMKLRKFHGEVLKNTSENFFNECTIEFLKDHCCSNIAILLQQIKKPDLYKKVIDYLKNLPDDMEISVQSNKGGKFFLGKGRLFNYYENSNFFEKEIYPYLSYYMIHGESRTAFSEALFSFMLMILAAVKKENTLTAVLKEYEEGILQKIELNKDAQLAYPKYRQHFTVDFVGKFMALLTKEELRALCSEHGWASKEDSGKQIITLAKGGKITLSSQWARKPKPKDTAKKSETAKKGKSNDKKSDAEIEETYEVPELTKLMSVRTSEASEETLKAVVILAVEMMEKVIPKSNEVRIHGDSDWQQRLYEALTAKGLKVLNYPPSPSKTVKTPARTPKEADTHTASPTPTTPSPT